jgi:holo-[acyl-carrier protein] synthase
MIWGIGIDIIEVERVAKKVDKPGFKERVFTEREIAYCDGFHLRAERYAARFAAKEAFFKAMGTGWMGRFFI